MTICIDGRVSACYVDNNNMLSEHHTLNRLINIKAVRKMAGMRVRKPGQLTDEDLMKLCGVTRYTTRNWRLEEGLPFEKDGKYIVYDKEKVMTWLVDRAARKLYAENIVTAKRFKRDFDEFTQFGQVAAYRAMRRTMEELRDDGTIPPRAETAILDAMKTAMRELQAAAVYGLAMDIQVSSPAFILAHPEGVVDPKAVEIDAMTLVTVKTIVMKVSGLPEDEVDEIMRIMKPAHFAFMESEEEYDDFTYEGDEDEEGGA